MTKKKLSYFFIIFMYIVSLNIAYGQEKNLQISNFSTDKNIQKLYKELQLETKLDYKAFKYGYLGFNNIEKEKSILTIVDFSKPSTEERFFVIDLLNKKVLYETYVSHGRNSGNNYATHFSNSLNSYMSSPGFYTTENTYNGGNGYSLRLNGLEKGINDRAKERAIVIHGASYANPSTIAQGGRLGRSLGCPALPTKVSKPIIDTIKNGSVVYIYSPDYAKKSKFVQSLL